jgi:hypothetical protein
VYINFTLISFYNHFYYWLTWRTFKYSLTCRQWIDLISKALFVRYKVLYVLLYHPPLQMLKQKQRNQRRIATGPSVSETRLYRRERGSAHCVRVWGTKGIGRSVTRLRRSETMTTSKKKKWRPARNSRKSGLCPHHKNVLLHAYMWYYRGSS